MQLVLPSQRNFFACHMPQTFGMLELGKVIFGLDLK